ncbi:MAG: hypothetical protein K8S56_09530, partial [Candidatus Cloacimonetes bacterium]|nr:hypothetical protein [Candidatus Cloacimonadota bacterium]
MEVTTDFNWILNIANNVIIIHKPQKVIFSGNEINRKLLGDNDNLRRSIILDYFDEAIQSTVKTLLDKVWKEKEREVLRIDSLQLYFFPAEYNGEEHIMISTDDTIYERSRIEHELSERVKELECLYQVSSVFENARRMEDALELSIPALINGLQFREYAQAIIEIDGKLYGDKECLTLQNRVLRERIVTDEKVRGFVQVGYTINAPFVKEEEKLLYEVSIIISNRLEKSDRNREQQEQRKQLIIQNRKLKHLTDICAKSRKRLETLFNAITDSIFVIDRDYHIEISNNLNISDKGQCYKQQFNTTAPCSHCPAKKSFETKENCSEEMKLGNQYYLMQAYPIFNDDGEVEKVLEIVRNITREKKVDLQLLQNDKLASLGKLVSGIAHEINNPNTFIRGNIKIVKESVSDILPILDDYVKSHPDTKIARLNYDLWRENIPLLIDDMQGGTNRIKKIVDGLRNFARKDEGLLNDNVDFNEVITSSIRLTENQVKRFATVELDLEENLPLFKGNRQKLDQVVVNLVLNAVEAIEGTNGRIQISSKHLKPTNEILIVVKDNGSGIDEQ